MTIRKADICKIVSTNLSALMESLGYTATEMMLKLNVHLSRPCTVTDIRSWVDGTALPSLYMTALMADFFRVSTKDIVDPAFNINTTNSRSFAMTPQVATAIIPASTTSTTSAPVTQTCVTTAIPSITRTKRTHNKYTTTVSKHITVDSKTNMALAYYVYTHCATTKQTLATFAKSLGVSRRSIRDYINGTTVPKSVVDLLVRATKTTVTTLGLIQSGSRFVHRPVIVR